VPPARGTLRVNHSAQLLGFRLCRPAAGPCHGHNNRPLSGGPACSDGDTARGCGSAVGSYTDGTLVVDMFDAKTTAFAFKRDQNALTAGMNLRVASAALMVLLSEFAHPLKRWATVVSRPEFGESATPRPPAARRSRGARGCARRAPTRTDALTRAAPLPAMPRSRG
jgi:hypothetical protein